MDPTALTSFDRIVILLAIVGGLLFGLLPVLVVLADRGDSLPRRSGQGRDADVDSGPSRSTLH
jgi:hypothetical protein